MRRQTRKQRIDNQNRITIGMLLGGVLVLWSAVAAIAIGAAA